MKTARIGDFYLIFVYSVITIFKSCMNSYPFLIIIPELSLIQGVHSINRTRPLVEEVCSPAKQADR